jgi:hypothetical protein
MEPPKDFWDALGGRPDSIPTAPPGDDEKMEKQWEAADKLYRVNPGNELFPIDSKFTKAKLDTKFNFIFDCHEEMYYWCGKVVALSRLVHLFFLLLLLSFIIYLFLFVYYLLFVYYYFSVGEAHFCSIVGDGTQATDKNRREENMKKAKELFAKKTDRPKWSTLKKINEGMEPVLFQEKFHQWFTTDSRSSKRASSRCVTLPPRPDCAYGLFSFSLVFVLRSSSFFVCAVRRHTGPLRRRAMRCARRAASIRS